MLRIKAVLILKLNATRDYLDFLALFEKLGEEACAEALHCLDRLYPQLAASRPCSNWSSNSPGPCPRISRRPARTSTGASHPAGTTGTWSGRPALNARPLCLTASPAEGEEAHDSRSHGTRGHPPEGRRRSGHAVGCLNVPERACWRVDAATVRFSACLGIPIRTYPLCARTRGFLAGKHGVVVSARTSTAKRNPWSRPTTTGGNARAKRSELRSAAHTFIRITSTGINGPPTRPRSLSGRGGLPARKAAVPTFMVSRWLPL